ncbi:MAG TPA: gliding motility-associated C-terminal domain-containing protein, partial [Flavilitoribacter sp.]|nr:gliding motility-associated C-terminal domain-containing protein [Flavilitoribacter sp.]
MPPCELYIDLDLDDSGGFSGGDFRTGTVCTRLRGLGDIDLDVFCAIRLDSVTVVLESPPDGTNEFLLLPSAPNLTVTGSGGHRITLFNPGGAALEDFENALNNIVFGNNSQPVSEGDRTVRLQAHSLYYHSEEATAFIPVFQEALRPVATLQMPSCFGLADGSISLHSGGGEAPYLFVWSDSQAGPEITGLAAGTYAYTVTDALNCAFSGAFSLEEPALLEAEITFPDSVCGAAGAADAVPSGGVGPYVFAWSNGDTTQNITGLPSGAYSLTLTDSHHCEVEESFEILPVDTVFAYEEMTICAGETLEINGMTFDRDTVHRWYLQTGQGCDSVFTLDLTVLDTSYRYERVEYCKGDTYFLDGLPLRKDTLVCRTLVNAVGCDSLHCLDLRFLGAETRLEAAICQGDLYPFNGRLLETQGIYADTLPAADGCDSLVFLELRVHPLPQIEWTTDGSFCTADTVRITPGQHASYQWSSGSTASILVAVQPGLYRVEVQNEAGCTQTDSLLLELVPIEFEAEAGGPTCFGDVDGRIQVLQPEGGEPPYRYALNGGTTQVSPVFSGLPAGAYSLSVEDVMGCMRTAQVVLTAPAELLIDLPPTIEIELGDSTTLTAVLNFEPADISWFSPNGVDCDTCLDLSIKPLQSGSYTLKASNDTGCIAEKTVRVSVDSRDLIYLPSAFSPNGDGVNDRFSIFTKAAVLKILDFAVYDRWGGQVYRNPTLSPNNPAAGWDGRIGNRMAPPGVYAYTLKVELVDGSVVVMKGEVLLLR